MMYESIIQLKYTHGGTMARCIRNPVSGSDTAIRSGLGCSILSKYSLFTYYSVLVPTEAFCICTDATGSVPGCTLLTRLPQPPSSLIFPPPGPFCLVSTAYSAAVHVDRDPVTD